MLQNAKKRKFIKHCRKAEKRQLNERRKYSNDIGTFTTTVVNGDVKDIVSGVSRSSESFGEYDVSNRVAYKYGKEVQHRRRQKWKKERCQARKQHQELLISNEIDNEESLYSIVSAAVNLGTVQSTLDVYPKKLLLFELENRAAVSQYDNLTHDVEPATLNSAITLAVSDNISSEAYAKNNEDGLLNFQEALSSADCGMHSLSPLAGLQDIAAKNDICGFVEVTSALRESSRKTLWIPSEGRDCSENNLFSSVGFSNETYGFASPQFVKYYLSGKPVYFSQYPDGSVASTEIVMETEKLIGLWTKRHPDYRYFLTVGNDDCHGDSVIDSIRRDRVLNQLRKVHQYKLYCRPDTFVTCVLLFDLFCSNNVAKRRYAVCIALASYLLAAQFHEYPEMVPDRQFLLDIMNNPCTVGALQDMERIILRKTVSVMSNIQDLSTPLQFLRCLTVPYGCLSSLSVNVLYACLCDTRCLTTHPASLAACIIKNYFDGSLLFGANYGLMPQKSRQMLPVEHLLANTCFIVLDADVASNVVQVRNAVRRYLWPEILQPCNIPLPRMLPIRRRDMLLLQKTCQTSSKRPPPLLQYPYSATENYRRPSKSLPVIPE